MVGVVTSWDILLHPRATIQCFGWRIFFRAVFPWHKKTFLSMLGKAGFFGATTTKEPALLRQCIGVELQIKRIYIALAEAFANMGEVGHFFAVLAQQEQDHADLLKLCRAAVIHGGWKARYFHPWHDYVPRLEQQMKELEASLYSIGSVDDALRLVIQIESSEINLVFEAILAATDSAFVKRVKAFRNAIDMHLALVCQQISESAPQLMLDCRELRAKLLQVK